MKGDTGRMLEQPSKSKYEHKLRNHLINSLSLTGIDIQLLLRKFWYSYCTQSFVSHSPLKNPIKSFGIFTQCSFACPKLDGNTNNNKDVLHEAAYESHQNRTLKNTKPFNLMPRLWKQTSTPGIGSWYSKLFPLLFRLLHSNLRVLYKLWLEGNQGCSCCPYTGLLQNSGSAQPRNLIQEQRLSPV